MSYSNQILLPLDVAFDYSPTMYGPPLSLLNMLNMLNMSNYLPGSSAETAGIPPCRLCNP